MKIKIKSPARKIIVPDLDDNLKLPEEQRFAVHMYRPAKHVLYLRASHIASDGKEIESIDTVQWALAHIDRLDNPPILQMEDGTERDMVPSDIFEFDQFSGLATDVLSTANSFHLNGEQSAKN